MISGFKSEILRFLFFIKKIVYFNIAASFSLRTLNSPFHSIHDPISVFILLLPWKSDHVTSLWPWSITIQFLFFNHPSSFPFSGCFSSLAGSGFLVTKMAWKYPKKIFRQQLCYNNWDSSRGIFCQNFNCSSTLSLFNFFVSCAQLFNSFPTLDLLSVITVLKWPWNLTWQTVGHGLSVPNQLIT